MRLSRAKLDYLIRVMRHRLRGQPRACPYCHETDRLCLLGRKKIIVEVIRCEDCGLMFRYPTEEVAENEERYQETYDEPEVTILPTDAELSRFLCDGFPGNLNFNHKIAALRALRVRGRVLDYGCSWGYGVRQLGEAGFAATGFEISRPRARFGADKLGVNIIDSSAALENLEPGSFDVIFSSHVIEHLPDLGKSFDLFARLLAPDGLLFAMIPNFTGRAARGGLFWHWIGQDHPIAPSHEFLGKALLEHGFASAHFGSGPFDQQVLATLKAGEFAQLDRDGEELLILAWTPPRESVAAE
ncbi:MAG: class I SAM-dependent methyltransferase [Candidatus Binataceae bacterium]